MSHEPMTRGTGSDEGESPTVAVTCRLARRGGVSVLPSRPQTADEYNHGDGRQRDGSAMVGTTPGFHLGAHPSGIAGGSLERGSAVPVPKGVERTRALRSELGARVLGLTGATRPKRFGSTRQTVNRSPEGQVVSPVAMLSRMSGEPPERPARGRE